MESLPIRLLWELSQPTVTDYTIWQGMSLNGVLIGMVQVITPAAQVPIQPDLQQVILALSAAAVGPARPSSAGLPAAAASTRAAATATTDFVFAWT